VRLNDRLDYFGSTVNLASRLQGESQGGDIVLSRALAEDPAVAGVLAPYRLQEETAVLKGFDRPIPFLRLIPAEVEAEATRRAG
jgi:class 3 adenylate cyclase